VTTLPFAGPANDLLIPFQPTRGFEVWWEHLDLHAASDPKVAAARGLLEDRLGVLSDTELETVTSVLWALLRLRLRAGARPRWFRAWLGDGDRVLRIIEDTVDSFLTPQALRELARDGGQLAASDSPDVEDLGTARTEVQGFVAADFGPATLLALAAGVGLVVIAAEVEALVHGHEGPDITVYGHGR
jgi:hypothetical protein